MQPAQPGILHRKHSPQNQQLAHQQSTMTPSMTESNLSGQSFDSLKTWLASPEGVIQVGDTKLAAAISSCYFDPSIKNAALWSTVLDAAICIPPDHPAQTSLANAVRELYDSKANSRTHAWDWNVLPSLGEAINPKLVGVNIIRPELRIGTSRSPPETKEIATKNLTIFINKLTTERTSAPALAPTVRLSFNIHLAVSDLRAAFEEPHDTKTSTGIVFDNTFEPRVVKACRWLIEYSSPLFQKLRAGDSAGPLGNADTLEDLHLGSLCATQGIYSIARRKHVKPESFPAISRKRWDYWGARIRELTTSPYRPELSREATRQLNLAAEAMGKAQQRPWEMYIPGK